MKSSWAKMLVVGSLCLMGCDNELEDDPVGGNPPATNPVFPGSPPGSGPGVDWSWMTGKDVIDRLLIDIGEASTEAVLLVRSTYERMASVGGPQTAVDALAALSTDTARLGQGCSEDLIREYVRREALAIGRTHWPEDFGDAPNIQFTGEICAAFPTSGSVGQSISSDSGSATFAGLHFSRYRGPFNVDIYSAEGQRVAANLPVQVEGDVRLRADLSRVDWSQVPIATAGLALVLRWGERFFSVPLTYNDPVTGMVNTLIQQLWTDTGDWDVAFERQYQQLQRLPRSLTRDRVMEGFSSLRQVAEDELSGHCSDDAIGRFLKTILEDTRRQLWPAQYTGEVFLVPEICDARRKVRADGTETVEYTGLFLLGTPAVFEAYLEDRQGRVLIPDVPFTVHTPIKIELALTANELDAADAGQLVLTSSGRGFHRVSVDQLTR